MLSEGKIFRDGPAAEVFRDSQALEEIGLAAPRSMYIMKRLREKGIPVKEDVITLSQAEQEILRCFKEGSHVS